jgi:DNA repair protein SbcD/Mre11
MRILHTSDWHLGRMLHGVDLAEYHRAYLDHLVELAKDARPDVVVVSGDVYDRALPPIESVQLLEYGLERLTEFTRVVVTSGNHDSAVRLGFGANLFRDRLHLRTRALDAASPVVIPDAHGDDGLLVYPLPYLDPDMARSSLLEWFEPDGAGQRQPIARSHEAVVATVMRRISEDLTFRRSAASLRLPAVAMAHAFVVGGQASESERDIRVGGVDSVPHEVFSQGPESVDYVALGHLHGQQTVGPREGPGPRLRYSGSPLAFSFSEMHQVKSTWIVDFGATGAVSAVSQIPAPVPRRLSEVRGPLDEVLGRRYEAQRDDWIRVIVTGSQRPDDLMSVIRRAFPHALEVFFERESGPQAATGVARAVLDPVDVMTEFVSQVRHYPPDHQELAVLRTVYEQVRDLERGR